MLRKSVEYNALYSKGIALHKMGRYSDAIAIYDNVLEINPNDIEAWCNKGTAYGALEMFEEAIVCFDRALEVHSNFPVALALKLVAKEYLRKQKEIDAEAGDGDGDQQGASFDFQDGVVNGAEE